MFLPWRVDVNVSQSTVTTIPRRINQHKVLSRFCLDGKTRFLNIHVPCLYDILCMLP